MARIKKLGLYMFRWQLSTPILYLVIAFLPYDNLTKTVIANILGAMIFFPVDEIIFNRIK